jgi:hypothetical protein
MWQLSPGQEQLIGWGFFTVAVLANSSILHRCRKFHRPSDIRSMPSDRRAAYIDDVFLFDPAAFNAFTGWLARVL